MTSSEFEIAAITHRHKIVKSGGVIICSRCCCTQSGKRNATCIRNHWHSIFSSDRCEVARLEHLYNIITTEHTP